MKKTFIFLLPAALFVIAMATGCGPNQVDQIKPYPSGTFAGQFRLLRRPTGATKIDTMKATIQLVLETSGAFRVLGDTATLHAGSTGAYTISSSNNYIAFQDLTFPKTNPPPAPVKIHLNGIYQYFYDGSTVFQMVFNSSDTLSYQYDLKRVN